MDKNLLIAAAIIGGVLIIGAGLFFIFYEPATTPIINGLLPVVIQIKSECTPSDYFVERPMMLKEHDGTIVIVTKKTRQEIIALQQDECVIMAAKPEDVKELLEELKPQLSADRDEKIRELKLNRTIKKKDVLDREELEDFLKQQHPEIPEDAEAPEGGIMSPYQLYVTPDNDAVLDYLDDENLDDKEEIYEAALKWVWVSEQTLNNEAEKWLKPEEFLEDTPDYPSNPVKGYIASDCSEQANTLVSLLLASGLYEDAEVRVVLGKIDFGGSIGGHAWVEVFEDGNWFALEATAGYYYDDDTGQFIKSDVSTIPYEYFRFYEYPVEEVWYYYNNEYFLDMTTNRGNAPFVWKKGAQSFFQGQGVINTPN